VNRALSLIDEAMLNKVRVDPSTYTEITYGYGEGASENWPRVAANLDFAHLVHGHPTTFPKQVLFDWARRKATAKNLLENEGSILSPVYYEDHTFRPMVGVWGLLTVLGARGDAEAEEIADLMKTWLRACVLNAAKASTMVTPKGLSDVQAHDSTTFKPGVLTARWSPYPWSPVVAVAACGDRGWDISDGAWPWYVVQTAAGLSVAEFGLGMSNTGGTKCKQAEILRSKFGMDTSLFSPGERDNIRLLILGNIELLRWALKEIGDFAPHDRCREIATTGGMSTVNLHSKKGATSCRFCHTVLNDGTCYAAGVDSPHRGVGGNRNREHYAQVDMQSRAAIGRAAATQYDAASEVECPLAPGEVLWDFEWGGGQEPVVYVGGNLFESATPVPPEPDPQPEGPADAFDWLIHANKRNACVRANATRPEEGFYGTISPVKDHPHLFIERVGPGLIPWSTRLLYRDEENERISIVAECGYEPGETGPMTLANFRIFFDEKRQPGMIAFPRYLSRTEPTTFLTSGYVIEHAVTDGGDPYRGSGQDVPAGTTLSSYFEADSVVNHLGRINDLGEPVAAIERIDTMGDRKYPEKRDREFYVYAFNERGSYGVIRWKAEKPVGQLFKSGYADSIIPDGGPCMAFGVDPKDPELRERWFCTSDYSGSLPPAGPPTLRPEQPAPKPPREKPSWIERMGL